MTDAQLIRAPIKIFARILMIADMNRRNNLCHVFHEVSEVGVVMLEAAELVRAIVTVVVVASLNQGVRVVGYRKLVEAEHSCYRLINNHRSGLNKSPTITAPKKTNLPFTSIKVDGTLHK
jgi:hypothetical protein